MDRYGTRGGRFAELRTLKGPSKDFPVYDDLVGRLLKVAPLTYDVTAAHVCAVLSAWAYSAPSVVATMMVRMGLEQNRCRYIGLKNDAMFICSKAYFVQSRCGKLGLLVYRGTEPVNAISWLTDANVSPVIVPVDTQSHQIISQGDSTKGNPEPRVHGGFYTNQRATWFDVQESLGLALDGESILKGIRVVNNPDEASLEASQPNALDNSIGKLEALYIAGHSLGGAMAALAAFRLAHDANEGAARLADLVKTVRGVYTFGQPMVGNEQWAALVGNDASYDIMSKGLFRHVYKQDAVPSLPPKEAGKFVHTGTERESTENPTDGKPGWAMSGEARDQMLLGELPLALMAFVKDQLTNTELFNGGAFALPEVSIQSFQFPGSTFFSKILSGWTPFGVRLALQVPKLSFRHSIADHFPANYVACSTPRGELSEFGDF